MAKRKGAIIPDPVNPTGTYRRVLCIPASPDWIALVTGALYVLTQEWYWDAQTGDVEAVVERAKQMYFEYQDQSGDCDTVAAFEIGMMMPFAGETPPAGWLKCDGAFISRTTYADLFAVIGELYGAGDGTTTFELPDGRGMALIGSGQAFGTGTDWATGVRSGTETVTLDTTQIPAHYHAGNAPPYGLVVGGSNQVPFGTGLGLATPGNTQNTGGGMPHNNMQPSQVIGCWMIYAGG